MENLMSATPTLRQLSSDELDQIFGGENFGSGGHTGQINWHTGPGGSSVSWPGNVGGKEGYWTMSSQNGVTWKQL
jgi:hypothetical protein